MESTLGNKCVRFRVRWGPSNFQRTPTNFAHYTQTTERDLIASKSKTKEFAHAEHQALNDHRL